MVRLRQDVAAAAKSDEARFALLEKRLGRLESGPRANGRPPSGQADVTPAPHELSGDYRLLQGKLDEQAALLERLQRRLDSLERADPADIRRGGAAGPALRPGAASTPRPAAPGGAAGSVPSVPRRSAPAVPEEAYKKALAAYMRGSYAEAAVGFRSVVAGYPDTPQAANAQYWLAEAYYSQGNYAQAAEEFGTVTRDYPDSEKVPSALYKQGDSYLQLNEVRQASAVLCKLIGKYPKSREAHLARERRVHCP
jgi:tol-pal system protein YbgF